MKINKLKISDTKFDINLIFYNFLKKITQSHFSVSHIQQLLSIYNSNEHLELNLLKELFYDYLENNIKGVKKFEMTDLIADITIENKGIFIFSLKLNIIKSLLLMEAKLTQTIKSEKLKDLHQLSLAYDKVSIQVAYSTRISGALLSLLFFEKLEIGDMNFMSEDSVQFISDMISEYSNLTNMGLEPNQIFMLLFSESINQSITSSAGASYEDRIKTILITLGIPPETIKKVHDKNDSSTEFDFFFTYNNKNYGISAKRTLRERYKQFIKTAHMSKLDVMIEITLGTDLSEKTANSIRNHSVYLFVADEVYSSNSFLQNIKGIYPASKLTIEILQTL